MDPLRIQRTCTHAGWQALVRLTDEELSRHDIAAVNLACMEGLRGEDRIDLDHCLARLSVWAESARAETVRSMSMFRRRPEHYEHSVEYFRILVMITVLQRDLGVRYNPVKVPIEARFDPEDSFIHGILQGDGGTCATLPVVYAAVGRRLRYPIKLASTISASRRRGHLFARWHDPRTSTRFNIEATNQGLSTPPDDYYRTGMYDHTAEAEEHGCLLVSHTPRQELAGFLAQRAWCFEEAGNWRRCVDAWAWAVSLDPGNLLARNSYLRALQLWNDVQRMRMPALFPRLMLRAESRQYPGLPLYIEEELLGHIARENLLDTAELESRYWRRMRFGDFQDIPVAVDVTFRVNSFCNIRLQFA